MANRSYYPLIFVIKTVKQGLIQFSDMLQHNHRVLFMQTQMTSRWVT